MLNQLLSSSFLKQANSKEENDDPLMSLPAPLRSFLREDKPPSEQITPKESTTHIEIETQGRLASWFSQADTDPLMPKGMSRRQRLLGFAISLLAASFCLCLAMIFLPMIMTPFGMRKYVLLHTLGSILLIGSFSFLWGPLNHLKSLFSTERLPFTISFVLSLFGGLYAVIVWQSALFAALTLMCQISLIIWQVIVSIPGGKTGLMTLARGGMWTIKGISKGLPV